MDTNQVIIASCMSGSTYHFDMSPRYAVIENSTPEILQANGHDIGSRDSRI